MYTRDNRSLVVFAVAVTVVLCCFCLMARLLILWLNAPGVPVAGLLTFATAADFGGLASLPADSTPLDDIYVNLMSLVV